MIAKNLVGFALAAFLSTTTALGAPETAEEILEATGVKGGFVVHLGSGDGKLTGALRASDSYIVHGLDRDQIKVAAARKSLLKQGLYGTVSIERLDGDRLPYTDRTVNLLVAEADQGISEEEIQRVLAPNGIAYVKSEDGEWAKSEKAWPETIDDWTHFLHSAGGNAVAQDSEIGPPRRLRWVGSPKWSRHHDRMASMSALVSAKGRMFYIMDDGSRISIQLPPKWTIVGRDAFNGTQLWKRDIPEWSPHLWPLKSGPTQLARRLVAVDDKVFVTLGILSPVSILDAATGETIHELEGSGGTEEIVVADDTVYVIAMKEERELAKYLPVHNTGDQARVRTEYSWNEVPRVVMAFDANTGKEKWHDVTKASPLTLSAADGRMFYHDGDKVIARDSDTGNELWAGGKADRLNVVNFNFGPKLVIHDDQVYFAGGDRMMHVYNAGTGKELWNAPHARGGYQSPEDLLIMKGQVWSAPLTSGRDSGVFTGRDLKTGEIVTEFPPNVETYWFHHRCYIAKATENFLMPSRTGIEFVNPETKDWDINHWVRGGCLYGVMPANGLTYAPPHNCACYPEAKLYGFNALAPAPADDSDVTPDPIADRLEKGPVFGEAPNGKANGDSDWPTFRYNNSRSSVTEAKIGSDLSSQWTADLGGRLSSVVIANNLAYVAQIDQHTVHALNVGSGKPAWSFTAGGRIDSPPTIYQGAAIFGSADGWVYCLDAINGALAWRFRAAPQDRRLMAFEQLESAWPVHGNVLVENDTIYCVAGRSNFLDGGLTMFRLDPKTGKLLGEPTVIDEIDPETGENLQERLQTLQMPAGLPDILSASGGYVYMRSQQFDLDGNRTEIGPHSGDAATHGAVQAGDGRHLFAPMSFLDETWFHRSYWVYGRSFAGGHNGYYQAGKNTPSGRILVFDEDKVYGFGRKPEYLKWTTTLEHQLFSAPIEAPEGALSSVEDKGARRQAPAKKSATSMVQVANTKSLNPVGKAISVEAWVKAAGPDGVIVARGGPASGYALILRGGKPRFVLRAGESVYAVGAKRKIGADWTHLAGVIGKDKTMRIYVNGAQAGQAEAKSLITTDPKQAMEIGADDAGSVGDYPTPFAFKGLIDEVRVYFGELSDAEIAARIEKPADSSAANAELVFSCSFDDGTANDASGLKNNGAILGNAKVVGGDGKIASAMRFTGGGAKGGGGKSGGSLVKYNWTQDVPLLARAMVKAGDTLLVAGPPDLINEEETFAKLTENDPEVLKLLAEQDAALEGDQGAILWSVSTSDGEKRSEIKIPSLPVWDGMAVADGKLFIATRDGKVLCYGE